MAHAYNVIHIWADFMHPDISHFLILAKGPMPKSRLFGSSQNRLAWRAKCSHTPWESFAPLLSPQSSIWSKNPILGPYISNILLIYRIPIYPLKGMPYFSFSHSWSPPRDYSIQPVEPSGTMWRPVMWLWAHGPCPWAWVPSPWLLGEHLTKNNAWQKRSGCIKHKHFIRGSLTRRKKRSKNVNSIGSQTDL